MRASWVLTRWEYRWCMYYLGGLRLCCLSWVNGTQAVLFFALVIATLRFWLPV